VSPEASLTPRHHRIRRRAKLVHLGLAPFAIAAAVGWIYGRLFFCWASKIGAAGEKLCVLSPSVPTLALVAGGFLVVLVLRDLHQLSIELEPNLAGPTQFPRLRRVRHGFSRLDRRHQFHVAWATVLWTLIAAGFCLFVGVGPFYL
jgi:hypothetical protein